jgi:hypothetical protein
MAFFVSKVIVQDPEQLRRVSESLQRLKELYGCTYSRLLQADRRSDTFLLIQEFPSMLELYKYEGHLNRMNVLEEAGVTDFRPEFYEDYSDITQGAVDAPIGDIGKWFGAEPVRD